MRYLFIYTTTILLCYSIALPISLQAATSTVALQGDELRKLINEKSDELKRIQTERDAVQKHLNEVSGLSNTLSREIKSIEYNINQLDLSIKTNSVVIDKLELELESLDTEVRSIRDTVRVRKDAAKRLLFELQWKDRDNAFFAFFRNNSLAQTVSEVESIVSFNANLVATLEELRDLQNGLITKMDEAQTKKSQRKAEQTTLTHRQAIVQDQQSEKKKILDVTKNQERFYEQKVDELEKKQAEIGKVIEDIEQKLRASFDVGLLPTKRPEVFSFPVASPLITQQYGATPFAQRAYKTKLHNGIDFGVSIGTPLYAAADGKVRHVDNNDQGTSRWLKYQYGKYVVLEHANNLMTLYAHLSQYIVSDGETVVRGQLIGYAGNSGYATGPHLHFGVYWAPSVQFRSVPPARGVVPIGVTIDPEDYL